MVNNCLPSLVAQLVKNPPTMLETWIRSLGWEDPNQKRTATHFSILAWRIPRTVESIGSQRVGHYRATFTQTIVKYKKKQRKTGIVKRSEFHFHVQIVQLLDRTDNLSSTDVSSTGFLTLSTFFTSPNIKITTLAIIIKVLY